MELTSVGGRFAPFNGGPPNVQRGIISAPIASISSINEGKTMRDTSHR